MIMQTASLLNRVGNLNFDVSYKVSFKFVCFKHGFNASQPEPVGEERVGGQVSLLHNFKTFMRCIIWPKMFSFLQCPN